MLIVYHLLPFMLLTVSDMVINILTCLHYLPLNFVHCQTKVQRFLMILKTRNAIDIEILINLLVIFHNGTYLVIVDPFIPYISQHGSISNVFTFCISNVLLTCLHHIPRKSYFVAMPHILSNVIIDTLLWDECFTITLRLNAFSIFKDTLKVIGV